MCGARMACPWRNAGVQYSSSADGVRMCREPAVLPDRDNTAIGERVILSRQAGYSALGLDDST